MKLDLILIPFAINMALLAAGQDVPRASRVALGIDVLIADGFKPLAGKRIGLITNPTGVASDLRATADILAAAPNVKLVALFGPEHGVRGQAAAGDKVEDARDEATGLPLYSLYGKNRRPTAEMMKDIDALVFDIQDIGSRSYTYISTMAVCMEAAAEFDREFIVLDRPNPLGGARVEGRPLDPRYKSFVGPLPICYVHGLTVGELARMINGEGWLGSAAVAEQNPNPAPATEPRKTCKLTVIPMRGWSRAMTWADTGLTWVPTSPHIPRAESSDYYAATGIVGELDTLSIGVGYPLPFELVGHPDIDGRRLADELNSRRLPGVHFRSAYFQPFYGAHEKKTCGGAHIVFTDRRAADLTAIQFHVIDAVRKLYPAIRFFDSKRVATFDKVCGTDEIRKLIAAGKPVEEVLAAWRSGVDEFRARREQYLLYK